MNSLYITHYYVKGTDPESGYLKTWFDEGESLRIPLDEIPDELIS